MKWRKASEVLPEDHWQGKIRDINDNSLKEYQVIFELAKNRFSTGSMIFQPRFIEWLDETSSPTSPVWPGEEEIRIKAQDFLAKRIIRFPGDVGMTDDSIRRNVLVAMVHLSQWLKERAGGGAGEYYLVPVDKVEQMRFGSFSDGPTTYGIGANIPIESLQKYTPSTSGGEKEEVKPEKRWGKFANRTDQPLTSGKGEEKMVIHILAKFPNHTTNFEVIDVDERYYKIVNSKYYTDFLIMKDICKVMEIDPQPPTSGNGEEKTLRQRGLYTNDEVTELIKFKNEKINRLLKENEQMGHNIFELQSENAALKAEIAKLKSGEQFSREDMKNAYDEGYNLSPEFDLPDFENWIPNYLTEVKQKK